MVGMGVGSFVGSFDGAGVGGGGGGGTVKPWLRRPGLGGIYDELNATQRGSILPEILVLAGLRFLRRCHHPRWYHSVLDFPHGLKPLWAANWTNLTGPQLD